VRPLINRFGGLLQCKTGGRIREDPAQDNCCVRLYLPLGKARFVAACEMQRPAVAVQFPLSVMAKDARSL
jgi:hypothetical protein